MLERLTITGAVCFGSQPLQVQPLQKVNYFFGPNGSGKTTISRALAGSEGLPTQMTWHDSAPMSVKVYNRDFVEKTLRESSRIPGVFVIGDTSVDAEQRLEEIEKPGGERAVAEDTLARARNSHASAESADTDAAEAFRESAWSTYKTFTDQNPSLRPAFSGSGGIGGSKQALVTKLLALSASAEPPPTLESLTNDADAVFNDKAVTHQEITSVPVFAPDSFAGYSLLEKRVVGSDSVSLSELVEQLGNSDWVSEGRLHLEHSGGRCPFCQQDAPARLVTDLAAMFDDAYTSDRDAISEFATAFQRWADEVSSTLGGVSEEAARFLDGTRYEAARRSLDEVIAEGNRLLESKQQTPSSAISFVDLSGALAELDAVVSDANALIQDHNALVANRKTARPMLSNGCWRFLAETLLGDSLTTFVSKQASRKRGIETLTEKIGTAEQAIADLDTEVRELHKSVESTLPVIEKINALLKRSGFTSFEIVQSSDLKDGYMLSRGDGELQEHSLSEGERTFIAFLYYFHSLDGTPADSEASHRILAVVDDPISSLDSDVLFVVGALVRHLINRALSGSDRIEQIMVLTHNVYFHKEVSHLQNGESPSGRVHFLIRKRPSGPSTITSSRTSPVTTEYKRLWDEVRRAIDGEQMNVVGLENILRRILESYFRVMGGGIWDDEITPLLTESERHVFRALFRWVNDGSHSILEDVYYSPSPISQDVYLQVFERIFEVTNQGAHFQMMIYGKRSLDTLAAEGSVRDCCTNR